MFQRKKSFALICSLSLLILSCQQPLPAPNDQVIPAALSTPTEQANLNLTFAFAPADFQTQAIDAQVNRIVITARYADTTDPLVVDLDNPFEYDNKGSAILDNFEVTPQMRSQGRVSRQLNGLPTRKRLQFNVWAFNEQGGQRDLIQLGSSTLTLRPKAQISGRNEALTITLQKPLLDFLLEEGKRLLDNMAEVLLLPPENIRAIASTPNSVTLKWDAVTGMQRYITYVNGQEHQAVTNTQITLTGLSNQTPVTFQLSSSYTDLSTGQVRSSARTQPISVFPAMPLSLKDGEELEPNTPVDEEPKTQPDPPPPSVGPPPGDYIIKELGMSFVDVPAGSFQMGNMEPSGLGNEYPSHKVNLSGFQMQTTEVTQKQWYTVMGDWAPASEPTTRYGKGDNYPMYTVSWCDIVGEAADGCKDSGVGEGFLKRLNDNFNGVYRLPTEAEWEYAARSGSNTPLACGYYVEFSDATANSCPYNMGWFGANNTYNGELYGAKEVGRKQPNTWGLYDMHGNVMEWVHDWYSPTYYHSSPNNNPLGPSGPSIVVNSGRVMRGTANWLTPPNNMFFHVRVSSRGPNRQTSRGIALGFRLVRLP